MSNSSYISDLVATSQVFYLYGLCFDFGFGVIGNLINILVLTNLKIFHSNQCAFYLIVESIVDGYQLFARFLDDLGPLAFSVVWCILKTMSIQWGRLMLSAIVCSAAIDQYLSTNPLPYLTQWSSLTIAHRQIYAASLLCILHTIPFGIFSQIDPKLGCALSNIYLSNYYAYFYYPFLNGLLPIFISSLFGLLAYRNVRRIIRRQIPIDRRRLDQQLTAMIFVRVISFVLLQLPYTIHRSITINVGTIPANTIAYGINVWARAISIVLLYACYAVSFSLSLTLLLMLCDMNRIDIYFSSTVSKSSLI
jgi:hypothetical protein